MSDTKKVKLTMAEADLIANMANTHIKAHGLQVAEASVMLVKKLQVCFEAEIKEAQARAMAEAEAANAE